MKARSYDLRKQPLVLEMGDSLQLEIEGYDPHFSSSLIGVVPDECLIIKAPQLFSAMGKTQSLLPGLEIGISCIHRGSVWGFKSRLTSVISEPSRLLMLEYPETIESWGATAF